MKSQEMQNRPSTFAVTVERPVPSEGYADPPLSCNGKQSWSRQECSSAQRKKEKKTHWHNVAPFEELERKTLESNINPLGSQGRKKEST